MFVVDFLHEFELGVWKTTFTHLIRILYAHGDAAVTKLNELCANTCHAKGFDKCQHSAVIR